MNALAERGLFDPELACSATETSGFSGCKRIAKLMNIDHHFPRHDAAHRYIASQTK
ncbi:MAG: hypothetical protein M3Y22_01755 [Pseudomonadota bacterium]|nr:hypothetical protein [Pseudomonadota bacterium]